MFFLNYLLDNLNVSWSLLVRSWQELLLLKLLEDQKSLSIQEGRLVKLFFLRSTNLSVHFLSRRVVQLPACLAKKKSLFFKLESYKLC